MVSPTPQEPDCYKSSKPGRYIHIHRVDSNFITSQGAPLSEKDSLVTMGVLQHCGAVYALLLLSALSLQPAKSLEEKLENSENSEEIENFLRSQLIASLSSQQAAAVVNEKRDVEGTQHKEDEHSIAKRAHNTFTGNLKVYIERASSLRDTDGWLNKPDPYVRVTAVDRFGRHIIRQTSVKRGTQNPVWNQWLDFGRNTFQDRFSMQIWDQDPGNDDAMSIKKEIHPITANYHSGLTHQIENKGGTLRFSYHMIMDGPDCSPNPCLNGGTCIDQILSHTCRCRSGYGDLNCRYRVGRLWIFARNAHGLQDKDGWLNNSDPYMEVIAYDGASRSTRRTTSTKQGTQNPTWNQWLDFGTGSWRTFSIRVWDNDPNADDTLCPLSTLTVNSGSHNHIRRTCYSGYVEFDYYFY